PNVLLRPLYQERILPNLCYIGGAGEISYWLQLKSFFEASNCVFPILCVRNSQIFITDKNLKKIQKLKLEPKDLLLSEAELSKKVTQVNSKIVIDFSKQKKHLQQQFEALYTIAQKTDASFLGAVAAQERKQIKGLEQLEKRLLKAQKRNLEDYVKRAQKLKASIFNRAGLQERIVNILELQTKTNVSVIDYLQSQNQALSQSVYFIKI
ncbi:MAG: bacillithiol biosynthesis BshC, partial [Flavobacteriaceae bacterium]|nr:bacillithiol biosynthesis BshC [Flavobacteriaceae bacterium]